MTREHAGLDLDALLGLWESPPSEREDAHADFAALYADPVVINDRPTTIAELVTRAEAVHTAFTDQTAEVLEVLADDSLVAFSFKREVRHTGTWATPLGDLPPSGVRVTLTGMDILTVEHGRVTRIRVLSDDLAVLAQAAGARLDARG